MIKLCSPDHNSTAVLVGDKLYAGTAADYQVPHHRDGPDGGDGRDGDDGGSRVRDDSYGNNQFKRVLSATHNLHTYMI